MKEDLYELLLPLRVLLVLLAFTGFLAAAYIGLWPMDAPACGTGLRPESMCFLTSTPADRLPEALGLLAGSLALLLGAVILRRHR